MLDLFRHLCYNYNVRGDSMKNWCGYSKQDLKIIRDFVHEINNEIIVKIGTSKNWYCVLPWYKLYLGAKNKKNGLKK